MNDVSRLSSRRATRFCHLLFEFAHMSTIPSSKQVRVAAVQASPIAYDLVKSVGKLQSLTKEAKRNGAQLVVFPEAFLCAYPRHLEFRVGSRSAENRDWYGRYVKVLSVLP